MKKINCIFYGMCENQCNLKDCRELLSTQPNGMVLNVVSSFYPDKLEEKNMSQSR